MEVDVTNRIVPFQAIQFVAESHINGDMQSLAVTTGGIGFRFLCVAFEALGGASNLRGRLNVICGCPSSVCWRGGIPFGTANGGENRKQQHKRAYPAAVLPTGRRAAGSGF